MRLISWLTGFFIAILILFKYNEAFFQWNKRFLSQQIGLVHVEGLGLSYRKRGRQPALLLNADSVLLRTSLVNTTGSYTSQLLQQVAKPALNKITQIAMRTILSNAEFHVKDLTLEKDGHSTHECHIYTDFKFTPSLPVIYSIGPISFYNKEQ